MHSATVPLSNHTASAFLTHVHHRTAHAGSMAKSSSGVTQKSGFSQICLEFVAAKRNLM